MAAQLAASQVELRSVSKYYYYCLIDKEDIRELDNNLKTKSRSRRRRRKRRRSRWRRELKMIEVRLIFFVTAVSFLPRVPAPDDDILVREQNTGVITDR
jgi:hypothetical protein